MMNRRSFLAALCALPIVGKFIPQETPITRADSLAGWGIDMGNAKPFTIYTVYDDNGVIASYDFEAKQWREHRRFVPTDKSMDYIQGELQRRGES